MLWLALVLAGGCVVSTLIIQDLGQRLVTGSLGGGVPGGVASTNVVPNDVSMALRALVWTSIASGTVLTLAAAVLAWFWIERYHQHLRNLASRDRLTGLLNRQTFAQTFREASLEMQRLKLPLSLVLFDIDALKKINESEGQAIGDKIIRDIARLSRRSVRGSDVLCRWGGEQFALLLKRCELDQAYKIAEQLRLNVQNHQFGSGTRSSPVTISLGVAQWSERESMDELAVRVDEAMFFAKSEGRNRAEISYYVNLS